MHVWPKQMLRTCYMLADVINFVYEVPCIFWHYINVYEVSWITLKKLLQSEMELLQIATPFLLHSATRFITNCDRYYKVRWIYYKLRQVLQSAMIITNCDSTSFTASCLAVLFCLREKWTRHVPLLDSQVNFAEQYSSLIVW